MSRPDTDEPVQDEVIAEVRAIRDALAAEFDYDNGRVLAEISRREEASDRPKIAPSPKRLSPALPA